MKKLINDPSSVVREMLEGVVLLGPGAEVLADENVVVQAGLAPKEIRKVAVLSGGGSGHEPAHAGYVGKGMLTAAIAGEVFTSPSSDAVLAAIRAVAGPTGALLIVKNYTGDRLNFGLAAELARGEGIPVEVVVVADDVALRNTVVRDRRRGIAGTILVHKVAGAAAERGLSLSEVARLARQAADGVDSMGISLGPCVLPAVGKPGFSLGESEIEIGLGIHGEQGVRRMQITSVDEMVRLILDTINVDRPMRRGERVALLVNGLGSTPPMELSIVAGAALKQLREIGVTVTRAWAGTFLSALDMPGFSLSVLRVDDQLIHLLDDPTEAKSWPGRGLLNRNPQVGQIALSQQIAKSDVVPTAEGQQVRTAVVRAAQAIIEAESELTRLDSIAGDGDLGAGLKRGGEAVLSLPVSAFADPSSGLAAVGEALRRAIAGSSGPFYATGLLRAARRLAGLSYPTASDWAEAFLLAVGAVSELGGAKPGDRTMVDALQPAAETMSGAVRDGHLGREALRFAAAAAVAGAEATRTMRPKLGRASYLADRVSGIPDGGAIAVAIWMKALAAGA